MRNRTVKPDFWSDSKLRGLSSDHKLVFIGLWQHCDDSGWGVWSPEEIAAGLFPYDDPVWREPMVIGAFAELRERKLLTLERCGHFQIGSLPKHVYSASNKRTTYILRAHKAGECPRPTRRPRAAAAPSGMPRTAVQGGEGRGREDTHQEDGAGASHAASVEELRALIDNPESNPAAVKAARKALLRLGLAS